jgi:hypothetical protein
MSMLPIRSGRHGIGSVRSGVKFRIFGKLDTITSIQQALRDDLQKTAQDIAADPMCKPQRQG